MAPAKQAQAKGSSRAAADDKPKDDGTTAAPEAEAQTATDAGYVAPTDPDSVDQGPRTDASTKRAPVAASPLEAGDSHGDRRPPVEPQRHLSTSPVAAAAGQRSLVGSGSLGLVDEEGNDLDPDDVFDFGDGTTTYATTKVRVYENIVQQGSRTPVTRLLFPANARVPRDKADLFVHASKAEASSPLTEAAGRERMGSDGTKAAAEKPAGDGGSKDDGEE